MSTKATIFLTEDNEHCYEELIGDHYPDSSIVLELNKKNIKIVCNDEDDLIVEIKPGCELFKQIMSMRK